MEVMHTWKRKMAGVLSYWSKLLLLLIMPAITVAQEPPVKAYFIKDGKMFIALGKNIPVPALDSFVVQYGLEELNLKQFVTVNITDSLKKMGWQVDVNNKNLFVISKPFMSFDNMDGIRDNVNFNDTDEGSLFSPTGSNIVYGYNRFKNKRPFATNDSVVRFFLRKNLNAKKVILSGSFVNWAEGLQMQATDSGWIADVKLGPGKYWYKFIIDGDWEIDKDNRLQENDGMGNDNSVYYKTNFVFSFNEAANAKKVNVAGSFNNWDDRQLQMIRTEKGWELPLYLADGTHTYRYIVDGNWQYDKANPDKLPNEFNDFNSVIKLGEPHLFKLEGYQDAKQVILLGSFNGWRKDELYMNKTSTGWEVPYTLGSGNYSYKFIVDGKEIKQPQNSSVNSSLIVAPNYTFRLKDNANAKEVFLAGDFNDWSPNTFAMRKDGYDWIIDMHLSPGKHLYKFVVDGNWIIDPSNKLWEQNEHGTGNSVLWIEN